MTYSIHLAPPSGNINPDDEVYNMIVYYEHIREQLLVLNL